ncbi:cytochrome-c oxidase, cbb3-type subunit III [Vreelandella malpeensis]|uniref:Cbb3-type cytochrome c oxidase subunit n=1 Tax=Vreelandella malpeensis TaxID=1172368 RepID=A0ABS8DP17_9GAMM|nr:cytochrome-c oxidase, cbb3-type subunit III [Halomonas malpeensis]MCB8888019.1 cytochrome-c oxidase, cbb3-type subunit III [Halomonas malpeensis]
MNALWDDALPGFWSAWIIVLTLTTLGLVVWIVVANDGRAPGASQDAPADTGADGIEEYDHPLPRWWFYLFVATVVFALAYLLLYPGLGNFRGLLGWTQEAQWEEEMARADERFGPIFARYQDVPIPELARDEAAMQIAGRIFANNCAMCHGAGAQGGDGFPDLTDDDWLYGGDPEALVTSIAQGRRGVMPAWAQLGDETLEALTQYVLALAGRDHETDLAARGGEHFARFCVACHGADGTGNQMLGAPNLTNDIWLYRAPGQRVAEAIHQTLAEGRRGHMPPQAPFIGEQRVHLVAAYVYSLRLRSPGEAPSVE